MNDQQHTVVAWILSLPCVALLFLLLMASLWQYREVVGFCLLALICVVVGVFVRGPLNEQNIRWFRFHHKE